MGGILALFAALSFTVDSILNRKGLMEENHGDIWDIRLFMFLTGLITFLVLGTLATVLGFNLLEEFKSISLLGVLLLIVAALLGSFIGGLLLTAAIAQIGATHASSLWGGANPLFAVLLAIAFLGEVPDLIGIFSVFIIVGGIVIVGYHGHEGTITLLEKTKLAGGILALLSGLCVAFSQIGRGAALNLGATPNTASLIFLITPSIIIIIVCLTKSRNLNYYKSLSRKSIYCYSAAGICNLIGMYSLILSFTLIPVWQAAAIRNIQPILSIILSWLFLAKVDKINFRLVLGAILVTSGVVILNVYK